MYYVGLATINDRRKLDVPFVVNHSQFGGPLPTSPHRAMTSWMVAQDQFSGPSATRIGSSPRSIATLGAYSRSRLVTCSSYGSETLHSYVIRSGEQ